MRSCCVESCTAARLMARRMMTAGIAMANSAVTLPRSPRLRSAGKRERTVDQVGQDAPHLVAAHDHDEQPGESDGGHRRDRVFGGRCTLLVARPDSGSDGDSGSGKEVPDSGLHGIPYLCRWLAPTP